VPVSTVIVKQAWRWLAKISKVSRVALIPSIHSQNQQPNGLPGLLPRLNLQSEILVIISPDLFLGCAIGWPAGFGAVDQLVPSRR
jgi:hypothetical protein